MRHQVTARTLIVNRLVEYAEGPEMPPRQGLPVRSDLPHPKKDKLYQCFNRASLHCGVR
jgi:hypothetical protein